MFLKVEYGLIAPIRISKNFPIDQILNVLTNIP